MLTLHSVAELIAANERFIREMADSLHGAIERGELAGKGEKAAATEAVTVLLSSANLAAAASELLESAGA